MTFRPKSLARNRDSFDTQRDMLMSIIHQHFDKPDESSNRASQLSSKPDMRSSSRRSSGPRKGVRSRKKASASGTAHRDSSDEPRNQKARLVLANPNEHTQNYIRPTGPELVSPHHPSCSGLPPGWNYVHDRFIAYLATHAPLDGNGRVQRHEERKERWKLEDIARLLGERFPRLVGEGGMIKVSMVEKRLALLDEAGDNDYFQIQYGAYMYEEWGRGI